MKVLRWIKKNKKENFPSSEAQIGMMLLLKLWKKTLLVILYVGAGTFMYLFFSQRQHIFDCFRFYQLSCFFFYWVMSQIGMMLLLKLWKKTLLVILYVGAGTLKYLLFSQRQHIFDCFKFYQLLCVFFYWVVWWFFHYELFSFLSQCISFYALTIEGL